LSAAGGALSLLEEVGIGAGAPPAHMLAAYDDPLGALLKDDEFERFGCFCDFDHMSQNVQKWIERFDLDVRPLLRRS